jgi:hypothetical protein
MVMMASRSCICIDASRPTEPGAWVAGQRGDELERTRTYRSEGRAAEDEPSPDGGVRHRSGSGGARGQALQADAARVCSASLDVSRVTPTRRSGGLRVPSPNIARAGCVTVPPRPSVRSKGRERAGGPQKRLHTRAALWHCADAGPRRDRSARRRRLARPPRLAVQPRRADPGLRPRPRHGRQRRSPATPRTRRRPRSSTPSARTASRPTRCPRRTSSSSASPAPRPASSTAPSSARTAPPRRADEHQPKAVNGGL